MKRNISIGDGVYVIVANDRRTHLFENIWPIPDGVSYNSYVIIDSKCALLDTVQLGMDGEYIERIEQLLGGRELDYLVVNHMEPDHSGEILDVVRRYPNVKIVGNDFTRKIMENYFGPDFGNYLQVADGEALSLGKHTLRFHYTPWVHWPESMMAYEESEKILFSADAFGTFGTFDGTVIDGSRPFHEYRPEMRRYYSNIVGKYNGMVQKALAKLSGLKINTVCPLHGPVWRERIGDIVAMYDKWSRGEADDAVVILYASMYGNTARMADYVADRVAAAGVRDIRVMDVSKSHLSYLISEIWRCRYVVLGSCSYNAGMFPTMEALCTAMKEIGLKGRSLAIFGGGSWVGGGLRALSEFANASGWDTMATPLQVLGRATAPHLAEFDAFADSVVAAVKKNKAVDSAAVKDAKGAKK